MTTALIIANIVCFILQNALQYFRIFPVDHYFALSIDGLKQGLIFQVITFQFLHGGFFHLLGNCLGLFFFGRAMEEALGKNGLLKLYLLSGTIGGLLQVALGFTFPERFGAGVVGASAGVFGLIAAFATRAPNQPLTILLFFVIPVTFPAKVLLFIEAAIAIFGIVGLRDGIAHAAHLGGMVTGIAYIRWLLHEPRAILRPRRRAQPRELVSAAPVTKKAPWKRPQKTEEELPSEEFISKEVDPILDKISAHGIQSLTDRERQILEAARKKMSKR